MEVLKNNPKIKFEDYIFVEGTPGKANFNYKGKNIQFNSFYMCKYTVNNEDFCKFLNDVGNKLGGDGKPYWKGTTLEVVNGKYQPKKGLEKLPAVWMSWYGAKAFCEWLGEGWDLPTEAQWEYAARGGQKSKNYTYSGSNRVEDVSWLLHTSGGRLHVPGELPPNELGFHDMSGNIWEWTGDTFDEKGLKVEEGACDFRPSNCEGKRRVRKGGSAWCKPYTNNPRYQSKVATDYYRHNMGIRPVFNIKRKQTDDNC